MFIQLLSLILTGIIIAVLLPVLLYLFLHLGPIPFLFLIIAICVIGGILEG
jgi:hypothetical protein